MPKYDDSQQDSHTQTTALSRQDERALARAITELAAAVRERREVIGRPANRDAADAADEYREIKSVLRTFLEKAPDYYHS